MNRVRIVLALFLITALIAFPQVIATLSAVNLAVYVLLYVSLASSWNIVGGLCGQTNLGHAAFFGTGALVARTLWLAGWDILVSILLGALAAVALALLVGIPAFRLKGVYFAIGTLALSMILYLTVGNTFAEISALSAQDLAEYQLMPRYYLFLAIAVLTVGTSYVLIHSRPGLGIMAVREQEDAAEAMGVSALKHKLLALGISAFLAGLTGGAFAYYHVGYYPQLAFAPEWTFDAVMMAYIGGVGTILGPVIGAIFFVILRELLALNFAEFHVIVFGVLFILVVLFLPGGLVGIWGKFQKRLGRRQRARQVELEQLIDKSGSEQPLGKEVSENQTLATNTKPTTSVNHSRQ